MNSNKKKSEDKMTKNAEADHSSINLIGAGTTIKGEINSSGDIRIDGTLIGPVKSKGKIIVGNTGVVEGEIYCQNADFFGKIDAKVEVEELLSLKSTAKLTGEISSDKLSIEPGAIFTGTCTMDKSKSSQFKTNKEANKEANKEGSKEKLQKEEVKQS